MLFFNPMATSLCSDSIKQTDFIKIFLQYENSPRRGIETAMFTISFQCYYARVISRSLLTFPCTFALICLLIACG
jgi:hypothetical protein